MKKEFFQKINIPEGVEAIIDGGLLTINGKNGENSRKFKTIGLAFEKKGNEIIIGSKKATKREKNDQHNQSPCEEHDKGSSGKI